MTEALMRNGRLRNVCLDGNKVRILLESLPVQIVRLV